MEVGVRGVCLSSSGPCLEAREVPVWRLGPWSVPVKFYVSPALRGQWRLWSCWVVVPSATAGVLARGLRRFGGGA